MLDRVLLPVGVAMYMTGAAFMLFSVTMTILIGATR